MSLLLLIILFGILGYYLARSQAGDRIEDSTEKMVSQLRDYGQKTGEWLEVRLGRTAPNVSLKDWAARSEELTEEDRNWLLNLSDEQEASFETALRHHAETLGMDLSRLLNGELDEQPERRKVYVEAVSVYSQAYRKAKEVEQESSATDLEEGDGQASEVQEVVEGKVVAEKRPSRRRRGESTA